MTTLLGDVRYAWRGLRRSPVFALVAVFSIALGIGANTAIFTLVDDVLLRLLPVQAPAQLVLFDGSRHHYGSNSGGNMLSFPMYEDFRDNFVDRGRASALPRMSQPLENPAPTPKIFSGLFARRPQAFNIGTGGRTERVPGELVSGTYFQVLGVTAAVGRVLTPDDDRERHEGFVAVISYDYWRNRFASNPGIAGQTVTINDHTLTIVGVAREGFRGLDVGSVVNAWVPVSLKAEMTPNWDDVDNRRSRWVNVFGRLKPGVTREQALAAMQPYFHALLEQEVRMPAFSRTTDYVRQDFLKGAMGLLPAGQGRSPIRQQLSQPLWLLFGVVIGVLLIACANVASLLIARAAGRQKEIAMRLALGATRARIVRQLLVESLFLAALGGAVGVAIAAVTTRFLLHFLPTSDVPSAITAAIDSRALAFNFALALATGVIFGLVPALRAASPALAPTLKDEAGSIIGGGVRLRKALVVAQLTISVLLLVGAGLFIRSLQNLRQLDLGLRTDNVAAFNLSPALSGYAPARIPPLYRSLLTRLREEPGVIGVAFASMPILEGFEWDSTVTIEGYSPKPGEPMGPFCNSISPGYFKTMDIPLIQGRDFDNRDEVGYPQAPDGAPPDGTGNGYRVAVVNESFARHYFGDRSPIGSHLGFGGNPGTPTPIEIIGVVKDSKYMGVRDEIHRTVYFPLYEERTPSGITVYARTAGDPDAVLAAAQRTTHELDANVPIYNPRTLAVQVDRSLLAERLTAMLSSAFGALATLLAIVGVYGVLASTVSRRTREIGVRMALGATSIDVVWLIMREVLVLVGLGVVIGLAGAAALSRIAGSQLFGVSPADPVTIASAAAVLATVALAAGYIPAVRATRVNPVRALRCE